MFYEQKTANGYFPKNLFFQSYIVIVYPTELDNNVIGTNEEGERDVTQILERVKNGTSDSTDYDSSAKTSQNNTLAGFLYLISALLVWLY